MERISKQYFQDYRYWKWSKPNTVTPLTQIEEEEARFNEYLKANWARLAILVDGSKTKKRELKGLTKQELSKLDMLNEASSSPVQNESATKNHSGTSEQEKEQVHVSDPSQMMFNV